MSPASSRLANGSSPPANDLERGLAGDVDARSLAALARALLDRARAAGGAAAVGGRWMAEWLVDNVPRIRVRDLHTLQDQHGGKRGDELAADLVTAASRASAGVGATAGALVGVEQLAPPAWLAVPLELLAETVAVAVIELKLVAELHEAYGRPVPGSSVERTLTLVRAWAERRGVTPATVATRGALAEALGRTARAEAVRLVRRRLAGRLGRNLTTLLPLMAGALAGGTVNYRATRSLGQAVARDLAAGGGARLEQH